MKERLAKLVKFEEGTKDNHTFTPLAKSKPSITRFRKLWLKLCHERNYEQLKQELDSVQKKGLDIAGFLIKEGGFILDWALMRSSDLKSLYFIFENLPQRLLQQELERNDFSLLNTYL